ncbi:MAG: YifB family Mg chelatase-like AAA ATPase [Ectothiorhodospiraceae bacterium]|nr:YifB family Mg chelatase-like AAA ATPase [Ectothiorhodospiraceae bacterium]MCH8506182.1 YifB family Mg chelatase-like AAA ATPase [Ectothiorhodospiraceae bacterium]
MTLAVAYGRSGLGVDAPLISVEIHLGNGLPAFNMVGLPETAVRESRDRVRSAIQNSGFEFPARRITVNLAPADLPKDGARFDLPIAVGILAASGQLPLSALERYEFAGELALTGALRPVPGLLPFALQTRRAGRELVCPVANAAEASLVHPMGCFGAEHLLAVCGHLSDREPLDPLAAQPPVDAPFPGPDLSDVKGQATARRALEIAAAGGLSLLLVGPPGTGKSMLASRLPGILPPMSEDECLESAAIRSLASQGFDPADWGRRPFRAPHHSASHVALAGGGSRPRPGEISLAHCGVLFLDELPEFSRQSLEILREPLETGAITISRAAAQVEYPARFQLVAAMNPCPCGHLGDPHTPCVCSPDQISRYRSKLSGPLLDRIDLKVEVPRISAEELQGSTAGEGSACVRERVAGARQHRLSRSGVPAAGLGSRDLEACCALGEAEQRFLAGALEQLGLSARAYHRTLRVALTIADLAGENRVTVAHLSEALGLRRALDH